MTRRYGRAPTGVRVIDAVPHKHGPTVTILGALGLHGIEAVMTVEGATDTDVLLASRTPVLAPTWRPGDLSVLDHLRAHNVSGVQPAIEGRGARRLSWPPDAPDLSPIDHGWSTRKTALRAATARPREALEKAVRQAFTTITAADAWHGFTCGGDA